MRAMFVGGVIDNKEMDLDEGRPPVHYPENTGAGQPRYRLQYVGERDDGSIGFAVYGAPDLADEEIARIIEERAYARRFDAQPVKPPELSGVDHDGGTVH
ncbi:MULTISPECIES: hypothetical protein [unclassified Pseudoxanthomonas]|jgi:hypothetical protein|uniref:hypothetical protein n=1 Tax=unclassified Pseudoxanthomonas TaxID=2645906 RepID=UPI0016092F41|nr:MULTISPECIES: hypothetical protein [unclassified Pseudoxanthomonas]MBB3276634.1 hypothetical protein [Pseudoxanthomonas sp. OG2]MBD9378699.1 hypothetical protein [Pseudoxanthomonas sp. PXM04]MBV7472290.1 hypothetical protein [Pseudoxanthomonas sp. PXM05]UBB25479.1 hypothetical protein LAG73_19515 [Pseudoxanthomonas japonensis]